jgi:hypothetical protein
MPPDLLERIDSARRAVGRHRLPFLLEIIERGLPTPLVDLDEDQEVRAAG